MKKEVSVFMPARLNSERLPNKLLLPLGDSNLWDIACRKLNSLPARFKKYVLLNDKELIDIAQQYPSITVIVRDPETCKVDGPLNFIIKEVSEMEGTHLMFLNPCLSLLSVDTIVNSLVTFTNSNDQYATSVKEYKNLLWGGDGGGGNRTLISPDPVNLNTKLIPMHYEAAHCFHIFNKERFLNDGCMLDNIHGIIPVPKDETMDVDTMEDYLYAKFRLAKRYVFDLDGTLCETDGTDYMLSEPLMDRINKVNKLYEAGNYIIIDTARGSGTGINCQELTRLQLKKWGLKYHELITGKKPYADYYIDDKGYNSRHYTWK